MTPDVSDVSGSPLPACRCEVFVAVQPADFDVGQQIAALQALGTGVGAVASFVGCMRDRNDGSGVSAMTLEHYPDMTEKAIRAIADEAARRWPLVGLRIIHRFGALVPGDRIVFVATASSHRGAAFASCEFIMDWLKTQAPFWKKEDTPDGARWVDARVADDAAMARWN